MEAPITFTIQGTHPFGEELKELATALTESRDANVKCTVNEITDPLVEGRIQIEGPGELYAIIDHVRRSGGEIAVFVATPIGAALLGGVISDAYTRIVNWLKRLSERKTPPHHVGSSPPLVVTLYGLMGKSC
jgi:hypothetical protein